MAGSDLKKQEVTILRSNLKRLITKVSAQRYLQAMVVPGIIWMIIFCYLPMYGIIISFKEFNIARPISAAPWVGLSHFTELFNDSQFYLALKNTLGISLIKLVVGFPIPIIFAIMLNELRSLRFKRAAQTISYLPHFISWVILGGILMSWLSETGIINDIFMKLGIMDKPLAYLAEPDYFWSVAIISDIWKEMGWRAIIYIAAIAGIDPQLYEAAVVDGAGRFRKIWHITLPCIKGTIAILFILAVSYLLNSNFDQILVLQNPLNAEVSDVIDTFVYRMGLQSGRFSFATAIGLFKSVVALLLLVTANATTKKLTSKSLF